MAPTVFGLGGKMLVGGPQQTQPIHASKETPEGRRDILVQHLVRRFLLQARVPGNEWTSRESTLIRFSASLLSR
jgi:hypothetical protein